MSAKQQEAALYKTITDSFNEAWRTCSVPWVLEFAHNLDGLQINFHQLMIILAAVAYIISTLFSLFILWGHLFHFVKPKEQRQIVRIILFVPFVSGCCFWSIWFYTATGFITPVAQCYEGFAITALFLLYVQLATPDERNRAQIFDNLERRWLNGKKKGDNGSLRWFKVVWFMVFQITFFRIATVIASEVLFGMTCPLSLARNYGHIIISTIQSTSTGFAVWGVVIFETRFKATLREEHQSMFKLVSFKAVVLLQATQEFIFPILAEKKIFFPKPPYHVSYMDFAYGLPEFLFIWELTIVAIMFLWSFSFETYRDAALSGTPVAMSPGRAFWHSLYCEDVLYGCVYPFTLKRTFPSRDVERMQPFMEGDVSDGPEKSTSIDEAPAMHSSSQ